jgi:hypothetical protein
MTLLTQKLSKLLFAGAICIVALALFVAVSGAGATPAQTNQVSFTATATGSITGVTKLPGGLTQINFTGSGSATHLGSVTGALTRIQDNQGNFGAPQYSSEPTERTAYSCPSVGNLMARAEVTSAWSLPLELTPSPAELARSSTPPGAGQSQRSSICARVPPLEHIRGQSRNRTRTESELAQQ